ncbi:MAG: hypothetical protein C0403_13545 [Desulfobacterium sp.]|nr:hypothetical protein [Desulfobacterium sp.]
MKITIVGAGVAGLTLGYLLSKKGIPVILVEKEKEVGGLARSFHYENWSIDIGPHRFHTDDSLVKDFLNETMQKHLIDIPRNSKVHFFNKHYEWPLTFKSLFQLPPSLIMNSLKDLVFRPKAAGQTFESYVMSKYGKTLTDSFFREYTQKFLKVTLDQCHRDWAETGINRATIDENVRTSNIIELLLGVLSRNKINTTFLYPKNGAIDEFPKILAQKIQDQDGTILTDRKIVKIIEENNMIQSLVLSDGHELASDYVFWSGSPSNLESLLGIDDSELTFCSTVLCNLLVEGTPPVPSQWEYFGSREIIFCRLSTNTSFNPALAPPGYYGICAEIVCYEGDYVWNKGNHLLNIIIQNLIETKVVRNFNSIADVHFEKILNTYPIYKIDYHKKLKNYENKLKKIKNLLAFGRTGGFWYNNMDHSIRSSIDLSNMIDPEKLSTPKGFPFNGVFRGDF